MSAHNITVGAGKKKRLKTAGTWCERDIVVEAEGTPTQEKGITFSANGTGTIEPEPGYLLSRVKVTVNVPEKPLLMDFDFLPNLDYPDLSGLETECIYRLTNGLYVNEPVAKIKQHCTTYIVDELPEVGEPCTLDGVNINAIYYNSTDEVLYAYVSAEIAPVLEVDADWYDAGTLLQALGFSYGGVVTSFESMTDEGTFYFIAHTSYFVYQDGVWLEGFIGKHECGGDGSTDESTLEPTPSLVYTLSDNGEYYIIGTGFTSIEAIKADTSGGNAGSGLDSTWQGGRLVIPKEYNGKPVLAIAPKAFLNVMNITSVYIFDGLTHIGHRCWQCTDTSGYDVAMTSIRLPNTLKEVGCGQGRILWGRQGLTTITLPNGVSHIENSIAGYCTGLNSFSAPMAISTDNSPMQNSPNITNVYLPKLEHTSSNLCRDCTALTSVDLPKIKVLGASSFGGCTSLKTIRLGADLEDIGHFAFNCGSATKKTTIIIEATTPPVLNANAFNVDTYKTTIAKIVVPKGCGNAYKTATNWTVVASLIEEATL